MARLFYRVRQFWQGLSAKITPDDQLWVTLTLPAAAIPLFIGMPVDAQRHSLNVLATLQAAGYNFRDSGHGDLRHSDLAVAALLHDCGKVAAAQGGVALGLWLRGPLVVLEALLPAVAARWASPEPPLGANLWQGWRYALYVQREHPTIGAAWAADAGCSALSCWLIAHHQTPVATIGAGELVSDETLNLLAALQAADADN